jgi:hypothetical protein
MVASRGRIMYRSSTLPCSLTPTSNFCRRASCNSAVLEAFRTIGKTIVANRKATCLKPLKTIEISILEGIGKRGCTGWKSSHVGLAFPIALPFAFTKAEHLTAAGARCN